MAGDGLQHQSGGRRHLRGDLPVRGGPGGPLRRPEASPGSAVFRILTPVQADVYLNAVGRVL